MRRRFLSGWMVAVVCVAASVLGEPASSAAPKPSDADTAPCPIGQARTIDNPSDYPGEGPMTVPFVVACPVFRHGGPVEIVAYRFGTALANSSLCLDTIYPNGDSSGVCRDVHQRRPRLLHIFFSGGFGGYTHIQGWVPRGAARVAIRYRSLGVLRRSTAVLTRVSDPALLARLYLKQPFAHYGVEASPTPGRSFSWHALSRIGSWTGWRFRSADS